MGEGPGAGLEMALTHLPSTDTVVPYFAIVDGLAAYGILGMDIGAILHQDLDTAQQALPGCQVQRCGAIACLTVEARQEEEGSKKGQRASIHQVGGQTGFQACSATSPLGDPGMSLLCPSVSSAVEGGFGLSGQSLVMGVWTVKKCWKESWVCWTSETPNLILGKQPALLPLPHARPWPTSLCALGPASSSIP